MKIRIFMAALGLAGTWMGLSLAPGPMQPAEVVSRAEFRVLSPIRQGNLTVFPVVADNRHDTRDFLTLDDGLRSGQVVVTESGGVQPLIRRRNRPFPVHEGAQVNQLVLINKSKRPLLLLAGEIVTGGKQDRVIGKDRIVPAESEPVNLGVFCVEPGRWVARSANFGVLRGNMAAPSVRLRAMKDKNQQQVWDSVRRAQDNLAVVMSPSEADELRSTTSYAQVMENKGVQRKLDSVAEPVERDYSKVIRELRDRNAVGVVAAVNGEIIWADIFASTELLEKYWPKLVRSYATEALVARASDLDASLKLAQAFVDHLDGNHKTVELEPGLYRHTEVNGEGYKVFLLASLLPKTGYDVHIAKMEE